MSSIVGLNDGADEQNKWVRVLKDVEEVCVRQGGRRRSDAADVLRNRINNEMPAPDASVPGEFWVVKEPKRGEHFKKFGEFRRLPVARLKMSGMWNQPCSKSNLPSWLFRPETNRCRCLIRPPGACRFRTCFHGVMACLF